MEERRGRKRLAPMSGELQAMVDYERHDPAEDDPQRRHPKKRPPATRGAAVIAHGLGRLALISSRSAVAGTTERSDRRR